MATVRGWPGAANRTAAGCLGGVGRAAAAHTHHGVQTRRARSLATVTIRIRIVVADRRWSTRLLHVRPREPCGTGERCLGPPQQA